MAELGESGTPRDLVPGDAGEIRKSTQHLSTYGDTLVRVGQGLQRLDTGGWTGPAADKFHAFFDGEPARWIECGDAFHTAAGAINGYANTLDWAQAEARRAIHTWDHAQQTSRRASQDYDQRAQQAIADGTSPGEIPPFDDPGEAGRREAHAILDNARTQLDSAGNDAVAAVDKAQAHAPEEPNFLEEIGGAIGEGVGNIVHYTVDAAGDAVDFATNAAGAVVEGAGWVAGKVVDGAGNAAGAALDAVGLDDAGDTIETATDDASRTVTSSTQTAGRALWDWGDDRADDIRGIADDTADTLGADNPPAHTEDPHRDSPDYVVIDEDRYPESAQHIQDAQSGTIWSGEDFEDRRPLPSELTYDPAGAKANRTAALEGIEPRGEEYLDRDEYPPAMMREGGRGASVQYIDASDNRGSGASMRHQIGALGMEPGDRVHIVAG